MLNEVIFWWAEQMRGLLPARLTGRDRQSAAALVVEPLQDDPIRVALLRRQARQDRPLGRFTLDAAGLSALRAMLRNQPATVLLRLPPGLLLTREVVLPLAAEREPGRVLEYEMDRITPFAADEVFWSYAIRRRDRARGKLHLLLSVVTKAAVQPWLAALAEAGIAPAMLEAHPVDGTDEVRSIDLRRAGAAGGRLAGRAVIAMAALCAVLALAAVALPFALQWREGDRVEAEIAALQPRVDAVQALRRRIAANTAGSDVIAAERARLGDTLAVLATVTALLPDDTSLTDLSLRQGQLTLNGRSAAAPRLIGALSADPEIRNADFAAPVTRIDNGRADQFAIRADVGGVR